MEIVRACVCMHACKLELLSLNGLCQVADPRLKVRLTLRAVDCPQLLLVVERAGDRLVRVAKWAIERQVQLRLLFLGRRLAGLSLPHAARSACS